MSGRRIIAAAAIVVGCRPSDPDAPVPMARTAWGTEVHWACDEIDLEPVAPPLQSGIRDEDLKTTLEKEARAWNEALAGCGVPRLRVGPLSAQGAARDDGHNRVVVKSSVWCPDDARDGDDCYDPTRQAKTTLRPRRDSGPRDGEIREADMEINAVNFRFSLGAVAPQSRDLRALVAHELGHVLGLEHACGRKAADSDASATRSCSSAGASESVMYPDPTEPGRPLVLAPTSDAVRRLCAARRAIR